MVRSPLGLVRLRPLAAGISPAGSIWGHWSQQYHLEWGAGEREQGGAQKLSPPFPPGESATNTDFQPLKKGRYETSSAVVWQSGLRFVLMITESLLGTEPDGKATSRRTGLHGDPVDSLPGSRQSHPPWSSRLAPSADGAPGKRFALSLVLPLVQRTAQSRGGNHLLQSQKK